MAAHLRGIHQRECSRSCTKPATVTLHNTRNAPIADYCQRHGTEALKEFLKKYPEEGAQR